MSKAKLAAVLTFMVGASFCDAQERDSKSSPKASLEASLSGGSEDLTLTIRLHNSGDVPIVVDKELVFLPDIVMVDSEKRAISFSQIRSAFDKPRPSVLKTRLVTLKPGEAIKREVHLRKGFKQFVTGIGEPVRPGGDEAPKVTAYEAIYQMPANARPFEIWVTFNPPYSFKEGFAQYMRGVDTGQFFEGPLWVSVAFKQ